MPDFDLDDLLDLERIDSFPLFEPILLATDNDTKSVALSVAVTAVVVDCAVVVVEGVVMEIEPFVSVRLASLTASPEETAASLDSTVVEDVSRRRKRNK